MRLQTEEIEIDFSAPATTDPRTATGRARIDELLDALPDTYSAPRRIHLLQEAARIYLTDLEQPESAIVVLQAALQEDMFYQPVIDALADLAERTGGWNALLTELMNEAEALEESAPVQASQRWIRAAAWYLDPLDEVACAQCALDRALALAPDSMPALELQARLFLKGCAWADVLATWDLMRSHSMDREQQVEVLVASGTIARTNLQDVIRATEYFREAVSLDSSSKEALDQLEEIYRQSDATASLCRILWKKAKLQQSRVGRLWMELEVAGLLDGDPETTAQARRIYQRFEDTDEVKSMLVERANAATPDERSDLHYRIARLLKFRRRDTAEVEWHLQEALAHGRPHEEATSMLLDHYRETNQWGRAATLLEARARRSETLDTKVVALVEAAAIHREHLEAPAKAADLCREARTLAPGSISASRLLAELLFESKSWEELRPLVRELLADAPSDESVLVPRLHLMAGGCAQAMGDHKTALQHYEVTRRHLPEAPAVLLAIGQLQFELENWHDAMTSLEARLRASEYFPSTRDHADILYQVGESHRRLGHDQLALKRLQEALALDPRHRGARASQTELFAARGDWRVVADAKRSRLQTATDEVKAMLLADLGDIESDELRSPQRALAAYQEALALQPNDHRLMQRVLDLAAKLQQWPLAYSMVTRFAELESDRQRKGQYHLAAAEICRDKLGQTAAAVEHYDHSLDAFFAAPYSVTEAALPRCMKAFADLDAILTREKAWKQQEAAYRRMIKRLPPNHGLTASLWTSLAEIYRSRLRKPASAAAALEVVRTLSPNDVQRREQLAELYALPGVDAIDQAIAEHHAILEIDPQHHESYATLAELYMRAKRPDAHWSICNALGVLGRATAEQRMFVEQHKATFLRAPRSAIPASLWPSLSHPEQDPAVASLLMLLAPALLSATARAPRFYGLKPKHALGVSDCQDPTLRQLFFYAGMLGVGLKQLYVQPGEQGGLRGVVTTISNGHEPALSVGSEYLSIVAREDQAFLAGQQLCRLRREHWVSQVFSTAKAMQCIVDWAVGRNFEEARRQVPQLEQLRLDNPVVLEQLRAVVSRLKNGSANLDARGWLTAQQATFDRAGLVVSGDLSAAARCMARENRGDAVERLTELFRFSTTEAFFELRRAVLRD